MRGDSDQPIRGFVSAALGGRREDSPGHKTTISVSRHCGSARNPSHPTAFYDTYTFSMTRRYRVLHIVGRSYKGSHVSIRYE